MVVVNVKRLSNATASMAFSYDLDLHFNARPDADPSVREQQ